MPRPAKDSIPARLRLCRGYVTDLSQREAERLAGLGRSAVRGLEDGEGNPTLKTLRGLAALYGVTVSWIVDGAGEPPTQARVVAAVEAARAKAAA